MSALRIPALISILSLFSLNCADAFQLRTAYREFGEMFAPELEHAPFPHPARSEGYLYVGRDERQFYPRAPHYTDNRAAVFVPEQFVRPALTSAEREQLERWRWPWEIQAPRASYAQLSDPPPGPPDLIFYFHGWNGSIEKTLQSYRVLEQFVASRRQALLVIPALPRYARDSFGGGLETPGGFEKFTQELMEFLQAQGVTPDAQPGRIALAGHSGGYRVMSYILEQGGLRGKVREVYLFDGLYARQDAYADWITKNDGRFALLHTEVGGTRAASGRFAQRLEAAGLEVLQAPIAEVDPLELRRNRIAVLSSEANHRAVVYANDPLRKLLEASALE